MTDPEKPALDDLLSNFALGPAWARGQDEPKNKRPASGKGRERRKGERERDGSGRRDHDSHQDKRPYKKGGKFHGDRDRREDTPPATGVRVTILPDIEAVHLIVREVHQVARCYPLFDVATTLLNKRERCHALFELKQSLPPMWRATSGDALFLTREDAQAHLWHGPDRAEYLDEETIEVEPPSGNFQAVAKCGMSGKWLGPPNFHTYQTELRRLHRERFSHIPFEAYSAKVRTERGEEAVNAWIETMGKKTRWRAKGEDSEEAWTDDPTQAKRLLNQLAFDRSFEQTHKAELPASASSHQLSAPLRVSLKLGFNHARKHAAMMIPAICKALEGDRLPVFKRKGKLYTGPVRPQPLPKDATLAPRPAQIVEWIRANREDAKLEGLWKAVLPEGSTAPPAEYAADLFWLLQQGHIQLHTDDSLVVMEERPQQEPRKKKAKNKAQPQPMAATGTTPPAEVAPVDNSPAATPTGNEETAEEPRSSDANPISIDPEPPAAAVEPPMNDPTAVDQAPEPPVQMESAATSEEKAEAKPLDTDSATKATGVNTYNNAN